MSNEICREVQEVQDALLRYYKGRGKGEVQKRPAPLDARRRNFIRQLIREEIPCPIKKQWDKNIGGILKRYNPKMVRALKSKNGESDNEASRVSRAKANSKAKEMMEFCVKISARYAKLYTVHLELGGSSYGHEATLFFSQLVDSVQKKTYVPPAKLVEESLANYNPNMARQFEGPRDANADRKNEAVRRCRARKAVQHQQIVQAGTMLKARVEQLKNEIREAAGL